ncbi:hypothetical protein CCACVL1_20106, partial [Corchorus capsularis]
LVMISDQGDQAEPPELQAKPHC